MNLRDPSSITVRTSDKQMISTYLVSDCFYIQPSRMKMEQEKDNESAKLLSLGLRRKCP